MSIHGRLDFVVLCRMVAPPLAEFDENTTSLAADVHGDHSSTSWAEGREASLSSSGGGGGSGGSLCCMVGVGLCLSAAAALGWAKLPALA